MRVLREIALLSNPSAGRGRNDRLVATAESRLRDAGLIVHELVAADATESAELARKAVAGGVGALVVCGGDGMVNLGAQVLAGTGVPLGIIPVGTGNDTARALDIPRDDVAAAADVIVAGRLRRIDLARSGDRYFATVLAAGFDAAVNERANQMRWPQGQLRYTLATLAELRSFAPIHYTLEIDGVTRQTEAMLVAVGNSDSFGGGLRLTHGASLDDGHLDVVIIRPLSKVGLVRAYPKLFRGTHVTMPQYERIPCRRVTVAAPGVVAYADGERFGALPLSVDVVPRALTVFAP